MQGGPRRLYLRVQNIPIDWSGSALTLLPPQMCPRDLDANQPISHWLVGIELGLMENRLMPYL